MMQKPGAAVPGKNVRAALGNIGLNTQRSTRTNVAATKEMVKPVRAGLTKQKATSALQVGLSSSLRSLVSLDIVKYLSSLVLFITIFAFGLSAKLMPKALELLFAPPPFLLIFSMAAEGTVGAPTCFVSKL
jgi:hypothetical protein